MRAILIVVTSLAACTTSHGPSFCGDGIVDDFEDCDDGNTTPGDGCSPNCQVESSRCGDGRIEGGEQCDDGNTTSGDGCSATCMIEPTCGNGHVEVGEQCDDGNMIGGDGCSITCFSGTHSIIATWALKTVAGAAVACPPTYDTAVVYSQPLDSKYVPVGPPTADLFDCATGSGTTAPLDAGYYNVYVAITNHSASAQYAQSLVSTIDLSLGTKAFDTTIVNDGGYFSFAWNLITQSNSSPLTCAQANAVGVEAIATDVSNSTNSSSDIWSCSDGAGTTAPYLAGTYTVSIDALNASMQSVGTAAPFTNQVIQAPNKVTQLGTVTIPITGF